MYTMGTGVLQDDVQAYAWFNIASSQGDNNAKGNRDILLKNMSPHQITKGQELSKQIYEKIYDGK